MIWTYAVEGQSVYWTEVVDAGAHRQEEEEEVLIGGPWMQERQDLQRVGVTETWSDFMTTSESSQKKKNGSDKMALKCVV